MSLSREELILRLLEISAIKVGTFTLKTGMVTPIYIDLRVLVSYPDIMQIIGDYFWEKIDSTVKFDVICGVPYTALPMATCISIKHNIPMVMRRKEAKSYGTKQLVEGHFTKGNTALIIEDVITSGTSVLETAITLKESGLEVKDALILLDRNQNGSDNLRNHDITAHCVFDLKEVISVLANSGKLDKAQLATMSSWINSNPSAIDPIVLNDLALTEKTERLSFAKRLQLVSHPVTKRLFEIVELKKSNLCISADLTVSQKILNLADSVGPHICMIKLHSDIISDFSHEHFVKPLLELAERHNFLIFEDRKFADIGNTVSSQYSKGLLRISEWADIVNAHIIAGPGVVDGLKEQVKERNDRACLLIAEMSSSGSITSKSYVQNAYTMAKANSDYVIGFICQRRVAADPSLIHFTPGINIATKGDSLGQVYNTPRDAIKRGADILIVGRAITGAIDSAAEAKKYQETCFQAYLDNLNGELIQN